MFINEKKDVGEKKKVVFIPSKYKEEVITISFVFDLFIIHLSRSSCS